MHPTTTFVKSSAANISAHTCPKLSIPACRPGAEDVVFSFNLVQRIGSQRLRRGRCGLPRECARDLDRYMIMHNSALATGLGDLAVDVPAALELR